MIHVGISVFQQPLEWIQQCLLSCLSQAGASFRLTVRLDGPDAASRETRAWLQQMGECNANLLVVEGAEQLGTFGSYQQIFCDSDATYLCQLDADDLLPPGALRLAQQELELNPHAGFVYTDCLDIDADGVPIGLGERQSLSYSPVNILLQFMTYHLRLLRGDVYRAAGGYDARLKFTGDYDLCLRMCELADPVYLSRPLYFYRVHGGSASQKYLSALNAEAYEVASAALVRRGWGDIYRIEVSETGEFSLLAL